MDISNQSDPASTKDPDTEKDDNGVAPSNRGPAPSKEPRTAKDDKSDMDIDERTRPIETVDPKVRRQKELLAKVRRYKKQITEGCEFMLCQNPSCATNGFEAPTEDKKKSRLVIEMLKKKEPLCEATKNYGPPSRFVIERAAPPLLSSPDAERLVKQIFSKLDCFDSSFLLAPSALDMELDEKEPDSSEAKEETGVSESVPGPTPTSPAINFEALHRFYSSIQENDKLEAAMSTSLTKRLVSLANSESRGELSLSRIRRFLILLENPLVVSEDPENYDRMFWYISSYNHMGDVTRGVLIKWLKGYSLDHLSRLLDTLQQYITLKHMEIAEKPLTCMEDISTMWVEISEMIKPAVLVVDLLHKANEQREQKDQIPYQRFYNDCINEALKDHKQLYLNWLQWKKNGFSFCIYPWIFDAASKADLMVLDSKRSMMGGGALLLRIRRDHLIQDSINQLQYLEPPHLRRRLQIKFVGEQGVDQGGVQREYFSLLVDQIFDEKYMMFKWNPSTRRFWFNQCSFESPQEYELVGMAMGLAIYQGVILDIKLPRVIFRKLMGGTPDWEDFKEWDPEMAQNLMKMKEFDGDIQEAFGLNFTISYKIFDTIKTDELLENGANIPVTNENVDEYIRLYAKYKLVDSVEAQFKAFKQGFDLVVAGEMLNMFRWEEVELLVVGSTEYDWEALERGAQYEGGYDEDHEFIRSFWKLVHSLPEEEKRKFLAFSTGSDRVPIRGLEAMRITISKNGNDDSKFPTSHTCFSFLLLPEYSSEEILKQRLTTAIAHYQGFGML